MISNSLNSTWFFYLLPGWVTLSFAGLAQTWLDSTVLASSWCTEQLRFAVMRGPGWQGIRSDQVENGGVLVAQSFHSLFTNPAFGRAWIFFYQMWYVTFGYGVSSVRRTFVVEHILEDVWSSLIDVIDSDGQVRESDGFLMPLSSKQHWPLGTLGMEKHVDACQTSMFVLGWSQSRIVKSDDRLKCRSISNLLDFVCIVLVSGLTFMLHKFA